MIRRLMDLRIAFAVAGLLAGASLWFTLLGGVDGIVQRLVERTLRDDRAELFTDKRLHVFTLGTGSPQLGGGRMPVANAVIAGDELLLIDTGEGASRTMGELRLPLQRITGVFITHWHSDHFAGLGQVLNQSWNADRNHAVLVHGPPGVDRVIAGLGQMYRDDIHYRSAGEVESNDPTWALGTPVEVSIPEGTSEAVVFERNGVLVRAFRVDHGHIEPAYGYRVEYEGRSVVFSGDTIATPLVAAAARNCDLLIHEAVNVRLMRNAIAALRNLGNEVDAKRAEGVIQYHADTLGVARVAQQAGCRRLVLSHIIPAVPTSLLDPVFLDGMDDLYSGPIEIAVDGRHFAL